MNTKEFIHEIKRHRMSVKNSLNEDNILENNDPFVMAIKEEINKLLGNSSIVCSYHAMNIDKNNNTVTWSGIIGGTVEWTAKNGFEQGNGVYMKMDYVQLDKKLIEVIRKIYVYLDTQYIQHVNNKLNS